MYGNKLKRKEKQYHQKFCRNSVLCSSSYKSSSRSLETNSTVQNVGPDSVKLLSKNGDDPTVQSLGIDRFLGCCSEKRELMNGCFFLSSIFCSLMLVAAQKHVSTDTLVSQVNKKINDLDFGPYLMGFPHGLRKTNPTNLPIFLTMRKSLPSRRSNNKP